MKRHFFLLLLLIALRPVHAQETQTATLTVRAPQPTKTDDGLIITSLQVETSDVNTMLELQMWRFEVKMPKLDSTLNYRLEMR